MNTTAVSVSPLVFMMFVASITPGPNNLMLMLAGIRFGFVRTLPHLAGITTGTVLVICLTYAGLGPLMSGHPLLVDAMSIACGLYLLWMASKLLRPVPSAVQRSSTPESARPMRFAEAIAFQFVNPKVWTMAVAASGIAARFPFAPAGTVGIIVLTVTVVNSPCIALWAAFGRIMRRQLDDVRIRRWFDGSMALLVMATAVWIVWPVFSGQR